MVSIREGHAASLSDEKTVSLLHPPMYINLRIQRFNFWLKTITNTKRYAGAALRLCKAAPKYPFDQ